MIALIDRNRGLGFQGQLLYRLPADMRHFKELTWNHTLVLGRTTLATFPGHRPLEGRRNLILSRQASGLLSGGQWVSSLSLLPGLLHPDEQVFVAGGASVYQQLAPYCQRAWLTQVEGCQPADCFFPALTGWQLSEQGPLQRDGLWPYRFCLWENPAPRPLSQLVKSRD